jgi:hypothetical protein
MSARDDYPAIALHIRQAPPGEAVQCANALNEIDRLRAVTSHLAMRVSAALDNAVAEVDNNRMTLREYSEMLP